jgi:hypothetical protein
MKTIRFTFIFNIFLILASCSVLGQKYSCYVSENKFKEIKTLFYSIEVDQVALKTMKSILIQQSCCFSTSQINTLVSHLYFSESRLKFLIQTFNYTFIDERLTFYDLALKIQESENKRSYIEFLTNKTSRCAETHEGLSKREKESEEINRSKNSEVDKNIPKMPSNRVDQFAIIIGNEDYKSYQKDLNNEINVIFAENDAKIFKEYVNRTLGVPEENINLLLNATTSQMNQALAKINLIAKNLNGKAELIFYYAGHGLPDENTKEPYLIPVDVSGANFIEGGIKLSTVYEKLTQYPSMKVSVFIDACFSGGARNQELLSARGIKMKPKEISLTGNIVVFSASSGEQSSLPYMEKKHGMFTYFLLKKIQETKGEINMKELSDYVKDQVSLQSVNINSKEQTPIVDSGIDNWGNWKLK